MTLEIGNYGEEMTLRIKQGATFGPFTATMVNPDTTHVNLTGCSIVGEIKKKGLDTDVVAHITFTIDVGTNGTYSFGMTDEETSVLECGETINSADSLYVHDIKPHDTLGRVLPLYYGKVIVFREVTKDV